MTVIEQIDLLSQLDEQSFLEQEVELKDISFRRISREEAKDMLLNYHYLHRLPPMSFIYGAFVDNALVGILTVGKPASMPLCKGVAGETYSPQVYELNRLYTMDFLPKNTESMFVGYMLKDLKPLNLILISYADKGMNHSGYIYQATNWLYTGLSANRTDVYVGKGKHSRTYTEEQRQSDIRKIRSSKHRYVYINGNKRFKKDVLKDLKYPVIPEYPKGEVTHYEVGEEEVVWLYNKVTGETFTEENYLKSNPIQR